jgi:hypothetical protein
MRGARVLLAGAPQPLASDPSLDAPQRAQLERAIGATTTVLFVATVSYVALSAIFSCLCSGGGSSRRRQQPDGGDTRPQLPSAAAEETKRALEEIPVVVVVAQDPAGSGGGAGAEDGSEEPGECAVCLAEYAGGEEVRVLPACRHGFHRACVDRWLLTRAPTCPVCRAPVAAHAEPPDAKDRSTGDVDAALP